MAIKDHSKLKGNQGDSWEGPWGAISPTPNSVTHLRLERQVEPTEKYLYPYRSFSRCLWTGGELEKIEIIAGRDRVTLTGKGLEPLFTAIDSERLQWAGETPDLRGSGLETIIYSIEIENLMNAGK